MKILLDDERIPVQSDWEVIRNHDDFIMTVVLAANAITTISFDHDLGDDSENGMWCLRWIVNEMLSDDPLQLPKLTDIIIHSANRVGSENMVKYIQNATEHVDQLKDVKISWLDSTMTQGHVTMPENFDYSART